MAFGENKPGIVQQAVEGPVSEQARAAAQAERRVAAWGGHSQLLSIDLPSTAPRPRCPRPCSQHQQVAASYLQQHGNAQVLIDYAAAARLARLKCHWVLGPVDWSDATQVKKALCWLSDQARGGGLGGSLRAGAQARPIPLRRALGTDARGSQPMQQMPPLPRRSASRC